MSSTPLAVEVQEQETNAAGPKKYPFLMYSKEAIDLNDLTVQRHGSPLLISSIPFLLTLCICC